MYRSSLAIPFVGLLLADCILAQDASLTPKPLVSKEGQQATRPRTTVTQTAPGQVDPKRALTPTPLPTGPVAPPIPGPVVPKSGQRAPGSGIVPGPLDQFPAATLYDNGPTDGSNGYSNATIGVFGARRTLLDDFTLTTGADITDMHWTHVWGQGQAPPFGVGAEFSYRNDAGGAPGAAFAVANVTSYTEVATGNVFFSRPEAASDAVFDPITVAAGTYWFEGTVVGADNNFWLIHAAVNGAQCWVNYDDFGGLLPGSSVFGVQADLNFIVTGDPAGGGCPPRTVWDNGRTDGSNGYSNATINVFGARRTLLDDFTLPEDIDLRDLHWTHIWAQGFPPPFGTNAELSFRNDAAGSPGAVFAVANPVGYMEMATGNVYFSRPEAESWFDYDPITVTAGTYWLEGTVVGADNNFWLVRSTVTGSQCWVNYDDFGGLFPGSSIFGVQADLNFCLTGDPAGGADCPSNTLWDNGRTDGSNGYSNATIGVFGARRTLLDDFTLPDPVKVTDIHWTHVWAQGFPPPFGTGAEFDFRFDAGGAPGAVFKTANVTGYMEMATGNIFFSRPEAESWVDFDPVPLAPGTHWFDGTVVGADNNFWLVKATVTGSECWVDYDDFGGLFPGSSIFGVQADLNFCLTGFINPLVKYCDPADGHPNNVATIDASGTSLSGPSITIDLAGGPANQFCYLLIGSSNGIVNQPPGAKGDLCIVGGNCLGRYAKDVGQISGAGTFSTDIGNSASGGPGYGIPTCGGNITRGQTWYFQYWHRQPMGTPSTFSQALCIRFTN